MASPTIRSVTARLNTYMLDGVCKGKMVGGKVTIKRLRGRTRGGGGSFRSRPPRLNTYRFNRVCKGKKVGGEVTIQGSYSDWKTRKMKAVMEKSLKSLFLFFICCSFLLKIVINEKHSFYTLSINSPAEHRCNYLSLLCTNLVRLEPHQILPQYDVIQRGSFCTTFRQHIYNVMYMCGHDLPN